MYKDKRFKYLDNNYNDHIYKGPIGILMNNCHKDLESSMIFDNNHEYLLEIGAGSMPHINFVKSKFKKYSIAEISDNSKKFIKENYNIDVDIYDGKNLPYDDLSFDRIIISHCLEHIQDPENFLDTAMNKLKKNGIISISLPTDPGILWRLGRLIISRTRLKKTYSIDNLTYNYLNAIEHINSIFNLINIIKYKYKKNIKESYYPFKLPLVDINLFYNVHISKN